MLAKECEVVQILASKTTSTIFVCGSPFDYSTFYERGEYQVGEELGGSANGNSSGDI